MIRCNTCWWLRPNDEKTKCPKCGSKQQHFEPSQEEIEESLRKIHDKWTPETEQNRRAVKNPEADVTAVTIFGGGKRRMKDMEGGKDG